MALLDPEGILIVSKDNRVLLHHGFERWSVRARAPGEAKEHDASVYASRPRLVLTPTGPGQPRPVPLGGLELFGPFSVDGHGVGFHAAEPGRPRRSFFVEMDLGRPRAVTPEGTLAVPGPVPRDEVLGRSADGTMSLHPLSGGEGRSLPWKLPADPYLETVGVSGDGRFLIVREGSVPARLDRIEIESGRRTQWMTLHPPDTTGAGHIWTILRALRGGGGLARRGLYRFSTFEEAQEWMSSQASRRSVLRRSTTSAGSAAPSRKPGPATS